MNEIPTIHPKLQEGYTSCFELYDYVTDRIAASNRPARLVEVGAWRGCSTAYMLENLLKKNCKFEFFVVDIWTGAGDDLLEKELKTKENNSMFPEFIENMKPFWPHFKVVHLPSVQAAAAFRKLSVDFVYIDALHTYDAVYQDITSWLPKVRDGGILSGHDYSDHWPEVRRAVNNFCAAWNIELDTRFTGSYNWMIHL